MKKIELRIGEACKKREITQADLVRKTKMRANAVSNLYRGYVDRLSLDHLEKIANALEIEDINELITLTDKEIK